MPVNTRRHSPERKVHRVGTSSLAVTLPSDWARAVGLKPGDAVAYLQADDTSLMVIPSRLEASGPRRALLQVPSRAAPAQVERLLIGCYIAGFDEIEVRAGGPMDAGLLEGLRGAISRLTGFVAVATEGNVFVARSYLDASQGTVDELVHRLMGLTEAMVARAPALIGNRDADAAREIMALGEQADRLYYLTVRLILSSLSGRSPGARTGLPSPQDAVGCRLVAKALEEICDSIEALADMVLRTEGGDWDMDPSVTMRAAAFGDRIRGLLRTAVQAFFENDVSGAERVLGDLVEMERGKEHFLQEVLRMVHSPLGAVVLGVAAVNLRDVCRFTRVIGEVALNNALRQTAGRIAEIPAAIPPSVAP